MTAEEFLGHLDRRQVRAGATTWQGTHVGLLLRDHRGLLTADPRIDVTAEARAAHAEGLARFDGTNWLITDAGRARLTSATSDPRGTT